MNDDQQLSKLRNELASIDRGLLELVAERERVTAEVGKLKTRSGLPTRDYAQEKDVLERARRNAAELGIRPQLAEELLTRLIRSSLTMQERHRVQSRAGGSGRRVLVVGGAGKMGSWFVRFLASQGFAVQVADPAGPLAGFEHVADIHACPLDHDLIVVATPARAAPAILEQLAKHRPSGVVFDIGSLKTPLRAGLTSLARAGVKVTSVHPMFGPDTELLSGRHVIFVDVGVPEATAQARELFASTMAAQVEMDLDSHDRLIAYILGLSHALNIAFFTTLAESGESAPRLAELSSTTFDAQLSVASRIAQENPHLYFEIQSLNDYGTESLAALLHALERLRSVVRAGDEQAFVALMERGREYLENVQRS